MTNDTQAKALGFTSTMENKVNMVTGSFASIVNMVERLNRLKWNHPENKALAKEFVQSKGFFGNAKDTPGYLRESLKGNLDMAPFEKAKNAFQNSAMGKKLQARSLDAIPIRRRAFDEFEGDWDYMRRGDDLPYERRISKLQPIKTLHIVVGANCNGSVSSADMDRYGAMVWAICQLIERSGIQVKITLRYTSYRISKCGATQTMDLVAKKPGEYIAPSILAAMLTANFYRRAGFAAYCVGLDAVGKITSSGLGSAATDAVPVRIKPGELTLSPAILHSKPEALLPELQKAFA